VIRFFQDQKNNQNFACCFTLTTQISLNIDKYVFILGTPTLHMLSTLPIRSKNKNPIHDIEDDENDIDMSAILNPKLSSTRIERPRRVHAPVPTPPPKVTNDYYNKAIHLSTHDTVRNKQPVASTTIRSINLPKSERQHSDIIEKVLAGIPLSDNEIRRVIHRPK
jgi:hypothetical protein